MECWTGPGHREPHLSGLCMYKNDYNGKASGRNRRPLHAPFTFHICEIIFAVRRL